MSQLKSQEVKQRVESESRLKRTAKQSWIRLNPVAQTIYRGGGSGEGKALFQGLWPALPCLDVHLRDGRPG